MNILLVKCNIVVFLHRRYFALHSSLFATHFLYPTFFSKSLRTSLTHRAYDFYILQQAEDELATLLCNIYVQKKILFFFMVVVIFLNGLRTSSIGFKRNVNLFNIVLLGLHILF